jgi:hypothetical protein
MEMKNFIKRVAAERIYVYLLFFLSFKSTNKDYVEFLNAKECSYASMIDDLIESCLFIQVAS